MEFSAQDSVSSMDSMIMLTWSKIWCRKKVMVLSSVKPMYQIKLEPKTSSPPYRGFVLCRLRFARELTHCIRASPWLGIFTPVPTSSTLFLLWECAVMHASNVCLGQLKWTAMASSSLADPVHYRKSPTEWCRTQTSRFTVWSVLMEVP